MDRHGPEVAVGGTTKVTSTGAHGVCLHVERERLGEPIPETRPDVAHVCRV